MPLTSFSIITPQQKITTGKHRDCEPVVKPIYSVPNYIESIQNIFSLYPIVNGNGRASGPSPRMADFIGLSDMILCDDGTICPSAGTISDSSYYHDNIVYSVNAESQFERWVFGAIFI